MDVREKLVELQFQADIADNISENGTQHREFIADLMIANGVTVQEWVPASEPPKKYRDEYGELIPFLVCAEDTNYPFRAMYDGKTWGNGIFYVPAKWWMPLPQPPKGE